jgi:O-antigen/teichoic acid export membrane protein
MCLLSLGQSKRHSILVFSKLATLMVLLPILFHLHGLPGAVWAVALAHFSIVPLACYYAAREGLLAPRKELLSLPALPAGIAAGSLVSTLLAQVT